MFNYLNGLYINSKIRKLNQSNKNLKPSYPKNSLYLECESVFNRTMLQKI
jgi:hypothetical protein